MYVYAATSQCDDSLCCFLAEPDNHTVSLNTTVIFYCETMPNISSLTYLINGTRAAQLDLTNTSITGHCSHTNCTVQIVAGLDDNNTCVSCEYNRSTCVSREGCLYIQGITYAVLTIGIILLQLEIFGGLDQETIPQVFSPSAPFFEPKILGSKKGRVGKTSSELVWLSLYS